MAKQIGFDGSRDVRSLVHYKVVEVRHRVAKCLGRLLVRDFGSLGQVSGTMSLNNRITRCCKYKESAKAIYGLHVTYSMCRRNDGDVQRKARRVSGSMGCKVSDNAQLELYSRS